MVTASLSAAVVVLFILTVYLASIVSMGQIATLSQEQHLTISALSSVTRHVNVRYPGYLTVTFNSTAVILVSVRYVFAGHNFTSSSIGQNGRIDLAVLPSALAVTFTATLATAVIQYSVYEQY